MSNQGTSSDTGGWQELSARLAEAAAAKTPAQRERAEQEAARIALRLWRESGLTRGMAALALEYQASVRTDPAAQVAFGWAANCVKNQGGDEADEGSAATVVGVTSDAPASTEDNR